eukprot:scpid68217/ scgid24052/ Tumor necrosis factor alpha-induced protein 8
MAEADGAKSKKIGLSIQKKLFGKMAKKSVIKAVIEDDTFDLIDELGGLVAAEKGDKYSEKYVKDLLKIVVKIGILLKNGEFNDDEIRMTTKFRTKLRSLCMTFISFHQVAFSHDSAFLMSGVTESSKLVHALVQRHLTDKSHKRVDNVFEFFTAEMFDRLFDPSGPHKERLDRMAPLVAKLVDEDKI